jgi:hypothetical protein
MKNGVENIDMKKIDCGSKFSRVKRKSENS